MLDKYIKRTMTLECFTNINHLTYRISVKIFIYDKISFITNVIMIVLCVECSLINKKRQEKKSEFEQRKRFCFFYLLIVAYPEFEELY